jgi:hypothetical protein
MGIDVEQVFSVNLETRTRATDASKEVVRFTDSGGELLIFPPKFFHYKTQAFPRVSFAFRSGLVRVLFRFYWGGPEQNPNKTRTYPHSCQRFDGTAPEHVPPV